MTRVKNHMTMWLNFGGSIMLSRWVRIVFSVIGVTGCWSGVSTLPPAPPMAPTVTTSGEASAAPSASVAFVSPQQHAGQVVDRAIALQKLGREALALDGTQEAMNARQQLAGGCINGQQCVAASKKLEATSKVGAWVGLADYAVQSLNHYYIARANGSAVGNAVVQLILQTEPNVAAAEDLVKRAMAEAQREVDARIVERAKEKMEEEAIGAAMTECNSNVAPCKTKCDGGDAASCVVVATRLREARKLLDAKTVMQKGCDAGMKTACESVAQIDSDIQTAAARVESSWVELTGVGDDLAVKRHMVTVAVKLYSDRPHMLEQVARMRSINDAIVTEKYCPTKKAFIVTSNAAEFRKRATAHCKDDPPVGRGLSGAEVPLPTECQGVYAISCP